MKCLAKLVAHRRCRIRGILLKSIPNVRRQQVRSVHWLAPALLPPSHSFFQFHGEKSQCLTSRACLHFTANPPPLGQCRVSLSTQEKMPKHHKDTQPQNSRKAETWRRRLQSPLGILLTES